MKCKCGYEMTINTWHGWVWECIPCNYIGRPATDKEIEDYERNTTVTK